MSTTVEEKFEEVTAMYKHPKEITLLHKINHELILVNGPNSTVDILSTKDLKVLHNLDTGGEMPFCAQKIGDHLFIGCNKGNLSTFNAS